MGEYRSAPEQPPWAATPPRSTCRTPTSSSSPGSGGMEDGVSPVDAVGPGRGPLPPEPRERHSGVGRGGGHPPVGVPPGVPGGTWVAARIRGASAVAWPSLVIVATRDAALVALDARTGKTRWETQVRDWCEGFNNTSGPIVAGNSIISGLAPPISLDSGLAMPMGSRERGVFDVFQAEGVESDRRS